MGRIGAYVARQAGGTDAGRDALRALQLHGLDGRLAVPLALALRLGREERGGVDLREFP